MNSKTNGGAIYVDGTSTVTINGTTMSNNRASNGGAVYVGSGATVSVQQSSATHHVLSRTRLLLDHTSSWHALCQILTFSYYLIYIFPVCLIRHACIRIGFNNSHFLISLMQWNPTRGFGFHHSPCKIKTLLLFQ